MDQNTRNYYNYYSKEDLRNVLRLVGSQYTMWTRFLLVSKASNIDDQEVLENRLYEVARDFGNVLLVYYDKAAVDKINVITRTNIKLIISLIDTILFKDEHQSIIAIENLRHNSMELAAALHDLNPYLDERVLTTSFYGLIAMTVDEITKRKAKQYALDVYQYNFIEFQILMIADILWEGFLHEFYAGI